MLMNDVIVCHPRMGDQRAGSAVGQEEANNEVNTGKIFTVVHSLKPRDREVPVKIGLSVVQDNVRCHRISHLRI